MALLHRCNCNSPNRSSRQQGVTMSFYTLACGFVVLFEVLFSTLATCQQNTPTSTSFTFSQFDAGSLTLVADASILDGKIRVVNMSENANTPPVVGRALYPNPVQLRNPATNASASFRTSFTFTIDSPPGVWPYSRPSGVAWGVFPDNRTIGDVGGYLGLLNASTDNLLSNRVFAIEVDTGFSDYSPRLGFKDISSCHLGVDLTTMSSKPVFDMADPPGSETSLCVQNKGEHRVNVEYNGESHNLVVELLGVGGVAVGRINTTMNLYPYVNDQMFVGFASSAHDEQPVEVSVLDWSFSSTFASEAQDLVAAIPGVSPTGVPVSSSATSKKIRYGAAAGGAGLFVLLLVLGLGCWCSRRLSKEVSNEGMVGVSGAVVGPRRFTIKELCFATRYFSHNELLGQGGSGSVYRGVLRESGSVVAVKVIRAELSREIAEKEFQAEVSIISQIRHRSLVQLHGWCKEKGLLCLVFEYLPNGSLDSLLRKEAQSQNTLLPWPTRVNILTGVAAALAHLHEEIGQCILHRGLKPANILLDANYNPCLTDFGLVGLTAHDEAAPTTLLAGTMGYMAPELPRTGRATTQTDVYSFGILLLEILCGRRPTAIHVATQLALLDCVWAAHARHDILAMADAKIRDAADDDAARAIERTLQLGLLCCHPDPDCRPSMRNARQILTGDSELLAVPGEKPIVRYSASSQYGPYADLELPDDDDEEAPVTTSTASGHSSIRIPEDRFPAQSKSFVRLQ